MRRVNQDRFRAARKARTSFAEGRVCEGLCHQQAPRFSFYHDMEWLFGVLSSYFAFCRSPCGLAQGTTRLHLSYGAGHKHNKRPDQTHSRKRSSREHKGLSRAKTAVNLKQTVFQSLPGLPRSQPPTQVLTARFGWHRQYLENTHVQSAVPMFAGARVLSSHSNSSAKKTTRCTNAKGTTDSSSPAPVPSKHDLHAATSHPCLSM